MSETGLITEPEPAPDERRIVVGVDGSESSRQALRWAGGEARLRGAVLRDAVLGPDPGVTVRAEGMA